MIRKNEIILTLIIVLFSFFHISFAIDYKADKDLFVINLDKEWNRTKSNDPAAVLRLEKGKDFIEISKLDDELSDFYLKARLKEQIDDLKNKGVSLLSDIKSATIHSVANAYFITYTKDSQNNIISFLTYGGNSYAFVSSGISESDFKDIIYFFRKPDEKVEVKKIKPVQPKRVKVAKVEKKEEKEEIISFSSYNFISNVSLEEANKEVSIVDENKQIEEANEQTKKIIKDIVQQKSDITQNPYIKRNPLNKYLTASIIIIWFILSLFFSSIGNRIQNPKLTPYPKEVPPDFFFPFIITRVSTFKETMYQIITRQKQVLSAYYNHESRKFLFFGIYGIIFIEIIWSLSGFINDSFFASFLISLPGGKFIASFPEFPFVIILILGFIKKFGENEKLIIQDSQMNIIMEVLKDKNFYAVLKDGKGKDVARLHKKGSIFKREWHFTDLDNQVAFTIIDDHPEIYLASKLFGSQGGKLRNRYSIFVDNKRVGFLFIDPNSKDGFQIHQEYDYARVAHPAQILASILYIISREKEKTILSF